MDGEVMADDIMDKEYSIAEVTVVADTILQIGVLLLSIPTEMLEATIASTERDIAIGPMLDPTAYLSGERFDMLARVKRRTKKLIELKKMFEEG